MSPWSLSAVTPSHPHTLTPSQWLWCIPQPDRGLYEVSVHFAFGLTLLKKDTYEVSGGHSEIILNNFLLIGAVVS